VKVLEMGSKRDKKSTKDLQQESCTIFLSAWAAFKNLWNAEKVKVRQPLLNASKR
jgi:hypothetical protein